ncbi:MULTISPECIES: hypothetical protein [Bacteria]|uniref:hypothetical protein n=1 Tax=Bacteria TaxID=2 RepID=UPI00272D7212|nr:MULTISPECIES: hypothetical protein [Bacteria]
MNGYYDQDSRVEMRTCPVCGKERAGDWFRVSRTGTGARKAHVACWQCRELGRASAQEVIELEPQPQGRSGRYAKGTSGKKRAVMVDGCELYPSAQAADRGIGVAVGTVAKQLARGYLTCRGHAIAYAA